MASVGFFILQNVDEREKKCYNKRMKRIFKATILTLCLGFLGASVLPACSFVPPLPPVNSSTQSESSSLESSAAESGSVGESSEGSSEESSITSAESSMDSSVQEAERLLDGVKYTLSQDGTQYTVTGYEGEQTSLSIESEIDGLPVTAIGERAFYKCKSLTEVTIANSITDVEGYAFAYCESLTAIVIPDNVTMIGEYAFAYCHRLQSVVIGDGVTELVDWSFYYCHALTSVIIGDNVSKIGVGVFHECFNLADVVLGIGLQSVGGGAFGMCTSLKNVYYAGSSREWREVDTGANIELTSAKRYYYVENEADVPTDGGGYWHYDENGEIAVW